MNVLLRIAVATTLAATGTAIVQGAQSAARSAKDGVYTTDQADQGKTLYADKCASCHGTMKSITPDMAPLLNDYVFRGVWKDRSVGELFERIRDTMPQNAVGTLSGQQLAEITAYILNANELPPGSMRLAEDVEVLKQIRLDVKP
jgi:mono/diheme cytochrome c family protein